MVLPAFTGVGGIAGFGFLDCTAATGGSTAGGGSTMVGCSTTTGGCVCVFGLSKTPLKPTTEAITATLSAPSFHTRPPPLGGLAAASTIGAAAGDSSAPSSRKLKGNSTLARSVES